LNFNIKTLGFDLHLKKVIKECFSVVGLNPECSKKSTTHLIIHKN